MNPAVDAVRTFVGEIDDALSGRGPALSPRAPREWIETVAALVSEAHALTDGAQAYGPRFVWAETVRGYARILSEHRTPDARTFEDVVAGFEVDLDGLRGWLAVASAESDAAAVALLKSLEVKVAEMRKRSK